MTGLLIALEGPDGCGKTTQIELLKDRLEKEGFEVIVTREPGGTKISEKIREILLDNDNNEMGSCCEALLYAASRAQLVEEVIKPALEEGKMIICDRFVHSSLVYQGIGRGLGVKEIEGINNFALNGLKSDLTIMIDIDFEKGLDRKRNQKKLDRLENSGNDFHKKVYDGYQSIKNEIKDIEVVDGSMSKEEVHEKIFSLIKNKIR